MNIFDWELNIQLTFKNKKAILHFIIYHIYRFFYVPIQLFIKNYSVYYQIQKPIYDKLSKIKLLKVFAIPIVTFSIISIAVYFGLGGGEDILMVSLVIFVAGVCFPILVITILLGIMLTQPVMASIGAIYKTLLQLFTEVS